MHRKFDQYPNYPFKVVLRHCAYPNLLSYVISFTDALSCQKQHIIRHNDNKVKHGANEVIAIGAIIDYMN